MTDFGEYRVYDPTNDTVKEHYFNMYRYQDLQTALDLQEKYCTFTRAEMTIMEAITLLNQYHDTADPDVDESNYRHAFQTGEAARKLFPDVDWLHFVAFIHDLGKILHAWGEPPHFISGDTFPVGIAISDKLPYYLEYSRRFASDRPCGGRAPLYKQSQDANTTSLNYKELFGKGLSHLQMCWGHDEYLYRVLKAYKECSIPQLGLDVIRYHSFYAWHTYREYTEYESDYDRNELLPMLQLFNTCDLYSKRDDAFEITAEMIDYYTMLAKKYCPGIINW